MDGTQIKAGTRIEVRGRDMAGGEVWEPAVITRVTKSMLPMPHGYHPVRFNDGGSGLLVHAERFRIVDNRA